MSHVVVRVRAARDVQPLARFCGEVRVAMGSGRSRCFGSYLKAKKSEEALHSHATGKCTFSVPRCTAARENAQGSEVKCRKNFGWSSR